MGGLGFGIDLLHAGVIKVNVHPFFHLILGSNSIGALVIANQRHGGDNHVDAHEHRQNPRDDFSGLHRDFFDQPGEQGIKLFEPYNSCNAPEKAI